MEFTFILSAALIAISVSSTLWLAWGVHKLEREFAKVFPKGENDKQ